jgi:hypothetical protein
MTTNYDGMFVARGIPEDIEALKQDAVLLAALDPAAGKEAVIGKYSVLVFRPTAFGRHALEALARRVARVHHRIEVAVALWQPNGTGFGVGFRDGQEWHRLDSERSGNTPSLYRRAWSNFRKTQVAQFAVRRAEWFMHLLSAGKLAWVMVPA